MKTLAALMCVYAGADPKAFDQALASLFDQTRPADEVVLVKDGSLTAELEGVVNKYPQLHVVSLPANVGAGLASQAGVEAIDAEFIARLDADDIAAPDRFELQLARMQQDNLDVLGTAVQEFDDLTYQRSGEMVGKVRSLPTTHEAIARYAKLNSPVNHPSAMLRRSSVIKAGNYQPVHFMEDYDLWARMLAQGCRFANLEQPLTYFRVSPAQTNRRKKNMFGAEVRMQRNLVSYGLISRPRAVLNVAVRSAYRALPNQLLRVVYGALFHR